MIIKYFEPAIPLTPVQLYEMVRKIRREEYEELGFNKINGEIIDDPTHCEDGPVEIDKSESEQFRGYRNCECRYFDDVNNSVSVWFSENDPITMKTRLNNGKTTEKKLIDSAKIKLEKLLKIEEHGGLVEVSKQGTAIAA